MGEPAERTADTPQTSPQVAQSAMPTALSPDLGRHIGSPRWCAQFASLLMLCAAVVALGLSGIATFSAPPLPPSPRSAETSSPKAETLTGSELPKTSETRASALAPAAPAAPPAPIVRRERVRRGDTLAVLLARAGANRQQAYAATTALKRVFNPRRLAIGQQVSAVFAPDGTANAGVLRELTLKADVDRLIHVTRGPTGRYAATRETIPLATAPRHAGGIINDSLFLAAERAGIPAPVTVDLIRIYSFAVDFQREIREGDRFELFFEQFEDQSGTTVKNGDILFADLTLRGEAHKLYRYTPGDDGRTDYFDEQGRSARRMLMRTPIDGARLTSRYGLRRHPILGYTRMHKGIDFGAARGTPVMAAGDGVIERASRYGGYGNYVRIHHKGAYATAYAHLSRFGRGIRKNRRVKQGQIIGYVGSTGRSTGPHLHYEVLRNNRQINPLSLRLPTGRTLSGDELRRFKAEVAQLKTRIAALPMESRLAQVKAP